MLSCGSLLSQLILTNFRAFKTCYSLWKKTQCVFANDIQQLYDAAQKLATLKQTDHDMVVYVSKAQSAVEELKLSLEADKPIGCRWVYAIKVGPMDRLIASKLNR